MIALLIGTTHIIYLFNLLHDLKISSTIHINCMLMHAFKFVVFLAMYPI